MSTFIYFLIFLLLIFIGESVVIFFLYLNNGINMEQKIKAISIVFCIFFFCMFGCLMYSESTYYFKEVLNYKVSSVKYQEKWSELVTYTVEVYTGTDSKGKAHYRTEIRTRTDYHGPFWTATLENGIEKDITNSEYEKWSKCWGNENHISTKYGTAKFCDKKLDGKCFESYWDNSLKNVYPYPIISRYKNKLRKSNSVFKYSTGNHIFGDHPVELDNSNSLISYGVDVKNEDIDLLNKVNAYLGYQKQIHIITVLVKNRDINVVNDILGSWSGLNKNELTVFIGLDNYNNINWCKVESWTDNTTIHGMIETDIMKLRYLYITDLKDIYMKNIPNNWKRKSFKDFDYIRESTEPKFYIISFAIFIIFSITQMISSYVLKIINENYYTANKYYKDHNTQKSNVKRKRIKEKFNKEKNANVGNAYVKIRKW